MSIKRSIRTLALAAVSFTLTTAVTLFLPSFTPSFTAEAKTKTVTFRVRDDSAYAVALHCNSQKEDVTVQPGKTITMKLAIGDTLVAANSTPNYPAGTTIARVSRELDDTIVALH